MRAEPQASLFEAEFHRDPNKVRASFKGIINEASTLPTSHKDLGFPLEIDLGGISLINSLGLRQWMRFIQDVSARGEVRLVRAPETMVRQFCLVVGSLGSASVRSVLAPYRCDACGSTATHELAIGVDVDPKCYWNEPPTRSCPLCRAESLFDDVPAAFFLFASNLVA